tara:strand:- start:81 stop:815 length:735 start_codon:yes stop_codon:yes gene_type:complete
MFLKIILFYGLLLINNVSLIKLNIKSMNFNLNKNSLWISYPLLKTSNNLKLLSEKLPYTHCLDKCKIFEDDVLDYRLFFNIFEVNTRFFSGNRLEIVTIAKNLKNNQRSFVILDCYTDVISWDPIDGLQNANCKIYKKITNSQYNLKIKNNKNNYIFNLESTKSTIKKYVLPEFSIFPNYICYFRNYSNGYNLTFNKNQIDKKVILLKNIKLQHNIYEQFIKEFEHFFIYPQKMNFKVYFNENL